jgi:NAD(P)H-hydrate epimerase
MAAAAVIYKPSPPVLYPDEWTHWKRHIPRRAADAHKGICGHLLIIAGSREYSGAPRMAARAALRTGAGLVSVGVPSSIYNIVASDTCEAMVFPLPEDASGRISAGAESVIIERAASATAIVAGPGLGRGEEITSVINAILEHGKLPLILDADGLNAVGRHIYVQRRQVVLTPHEGEFRRLGGRLPELSRSKAAGDLAARTGCVVTLKGPGTVTARPDGGIRVNPSGNSGLAKGGSGDLLAGMIGALAAQGINAGNAAEFGVFLHGLAADIAARNGSQMGMMPTDILQYVPQLLRDFDAM